MLLTKPHRNIDEMLDRIKVFKMRADNKAALMQIMEAQRIYYRGLMSTMLLPHETHHFHRTECLRLYYKRLPFWFDVVVCNIKLGQLDEMDYHSLMDCILEVACPEVARKFSTGHKLLKEEKGREALRTVVPALHMIEEEYCNKEEIDAIEARLVATGLVDLSDIRGVPRESTTAFGACRVKVRHTLSASQRQQAVNVVDSVFRRGMLAPIYNIQFFLFARWSAILPGHFTKLVRQTDSVSYGLFLTSTASRQIFYPTTHGMKGFQ